MTAADQHPPLPGLWELIDMAHRIDGARALHLAIGRPPTVRTADRALVPLEGVPSVGWREMLALLQRVVDPERWDSLESMGEGELTLAPPGNAPPITLTLYRSSEAWQAVVHL